MVVADASLTTLSYARESTSEVNLLTSSGPTAGTFTLTVFGATTAGINFNAAAAGVQSAIEAIHGAGCVTCTDGGTGANLATSGHTVTLNWALGRFQGQDITITGTFTGLTASNSIALTTTTAGGAALGYAVSPSNAGFQTVRMVSEDLGQDKEIVSSDEIVNDRRPPDNIQVNSTGSGSIVSEVIGGANGWMDDMWMSSIGQVAPFVGHLTTQTFSTGTLSVDNVGGNADRITMTHSATSFQSGFTAGSFVLVSGFVADNAGNSLTYLNSVYQVVSGASSTALTLTRGPRVTTASPPRVTPTLTGGTAVTFSKYGVLVDSTSVPTFTFQRQYSIASEYARMAGFAVDGFDFDMSPKRPMRITWKLVGKEELSATTTLATSLISAPTNKSMAPVADMKSFAVGEDGHSFQLTSFKLSVSGGLYMQDEEAGTLGPQGIGAGTYKVTGSCEFYYEGGTLHSFYQQFVDKSILFSLGNVALDGVLFFMPRCNFTGGRRATPGKDQATKGRLDFTAAKGTDTVDSTTYLLKIGRR